jgi:nascent polypeptide-associated complex subunit alpha
MRRISPREAKRMMSRMGINAEEMSEIKEVIFRTTNKELVIRNPSVTALDFQGQRIFQVIGEGVEERELSMLEGVKPVEKKIPEEDAQLVAQQASVSIDEAKKALEQTDGDLAQAILLLASRRK